MHANLRLGEVSRSVIEAARWAEAINRAGQLRMLAQRLARLAAQTLAQVDVKRSREQRRQTADRVVQNLGSSRQAGSRRGVLRRTRAGESGMAAA